MSASRILKVDAINNCESLSNGERIAMGVKI